MSDKTATSDRWVIWQEVHAGKSLTGSLRFVYRDRKSGDWFRFDLYSSVASGPVALETKIAERVLAKVTDPDALDVSYFDIYPKAWYVTVYNGFAILRMAALADQNEPPGNAHQEPYRRIAEIVAEVRGMAPWPPTAE